MRIVILALVLTFSSAGLARGEIAIGFTAEWLSHESSLIALATPVEVTTMNRHDIIGYTKCRYRLDNVIKGPESINDIVTIYDYRYNKAEFLALDKARKEEKRVLVFAKVAEHVYPEVNGKYVLTRINEFKSVYHFGQPVSKLFTPSFESLVKFEELVRRARKQSEHESNLRQQYWTGRIAKQSLEVPYESEIYKQLYSGSSCYLWVPEYIEDETKGTK